MKTAAGQDEISPRPVIGIIVVVSGLAVSFLLWLLYVHQASADFAGRWMFLPALNAVLNGLSAIALCVGFYFIKHHDREAHRASMLLAFAFSFIFLISYIANHTHCTATRFSPVTDRFGRCTFLSWRAILSSPSLRCRWCSRPSFSSLTGRFAKCTGESRAGRSLFGFTFYRSPASWFSSSFGHYAHIRLLILRGMRSICS